MVTYQPFIFATLWTILYMLLGIPLSPTLTVIVCLGNLLATIYFIFVGVMINAARSGRFSDVFKTTVNNDTKLSPLLLDGVLAIIISSISFMFCTVGQKGVLEYLFLTSGFVSILFFCEVSLRIYSHYIDLLKTLHGREDDDEDA